MKNVISIISMLFGDIKGFFNEINFFFQILVSKIADIKEIIYIILLMIKIN